MSWEEAAQAIAQAWERDAGLAETVLQIARGEWPDMDPGPTLDALAEHAREVRALLDPAPSRTPMEEVAALNEVLFTRHGYAGDSDDYYAADNSYLHRVVARRRGMPITLSVVYCDVAQRAGIPVVGIGFPGHFLVQYAGAIPRLLVDPFAGGRIVTAAGCLDLLRAVHGEPRPLEPEMLAEASPRDVVLRILRNLKGTFLRAADLPRARGVLDCLLLLAPGATNEWRERGLVRIKQEDAGGALSDLRRFVERAEPGSDTREVDDLIASLTAHVARLN